MKFKEGKKKYKIKKLSETSQATISHRKKCLYCGVAFMSVRTTAKYCSDTCKVKFFNYRKYHIGNVPYNWAHALSLNVKTQ